MQLQMPDLPHRITITILLVHTGYFALTAAGGWMLYQSALTHMDTTAETIVERLSERIDANGERIDRNGERIDRNGELIAQLRERMAAVEVRVGALEVRVKAVEDLVRFFHPPGDERQRSNP